MQLVERLGREGKYSYGLFLCPKCHCNAKMVMESGKRSKQCYKCYQTGKGGENNPNFRHGASVKRQTRLYRIWAGIKTRATNKKWKRAHRYVLRGITMCEEWNDFREFERWATNSGYGETLTIDRVDNDLGYFPSNCRWVTRIINSQNSSTAKIDISKARIIKERLSRGEVRDSIAKELGCSTVIVREIANGNTWRNA